jgi:hypothetical protein
VSELTSFLVADQSSAANLTYASNFQKSKIYKGKFAAGREKFTMAPRTLSVFFKGPYWTYIKSQKILGPANKHFLEHFKKLARGRRIPPPLWGIGLIRVLESHS